MWRLRDSSVVCLHASSSPWRGWDTRCHPISIIRRLDGERDSERGGWGSRSCDKEQAWSEPMKGGHLGFKAGEYSGILIASRSPSHLVPSVPRSEMPPHASSAAPSFVPTLHNTCPTLPPSCRPVDNAFRLPSSTHRRETVPRSARFTSLALVLTIRQSAMFSLPSRQNTTL
jgi:hypothetical protein